jgi:hypothetical protein
MEKVKKDLVRRKETLNFSFQSLVETIIPQFQKMKRRKPVQLNRMI